MLLTEIRRVPRGKIARLERRPSRGHRVRVDPLDRYREVKRLLADGVVGSQAELAAFLKVSRARVSKLFALDRLDPAVWKWLEGGGAPYREVVPENLLREIAAQPASHQLPALRAWCGWVRGGLGLDATAPGPGDA